MIARKFRCIGVWIIDLSIICFVVYIIDLSVIGDNGNATEGITKDKILNQPVLEEGTFLSYASKVCNIFHQFIFLDFLIKLCFLYA